MTVQAGIEFDLELLVGELPVIPCESVGHATVKFVHDDGPATHYVQGIHEGCRSFGQIEAMCEKAVGILLDFADEEFQCLKCGQFLPLREQCKVIGPIR